MSWQRHALEADLRDVREVLDDHVRRGERVAARRVARDRFEIDRRLAQVVLAEDALGGGAGLDLQRLRTPADPAAPPARPRRRWDRCTRPARSRRTRCRRRAPRAPSPSWCRGSSPTTRSRCRSRATAPTEPCRAASAAAAACRAPAARPASACARAERIAPSLVRSRPSCRAWSRAGRCRRDTSGRCTRTRLEATRSVQRACVHRIPYKGGMQRGLLLCAAMCACSATAHADDFWKFWGDGKAELDGYALIEPRYGQPRQGTAVAIFVTEDFSDALRVKADPGKHPASDIVPVIKLNLVRDFQTRHLRLQHDDVDVLAHRVRRRRLLAAHEELVLVAGVVRQRLCAVADARG